MTEDLQAWVGRTETRTDVIGVERCVAMQAAVDSLVCGGVKPLVAGDSLPPLWHWLYFWDVAPRSNLGRDGHPALSGAFLPPVGPARRMWAGSRVAFPGTLKLGEPATRVSTIDKIAEKQGRTGRLVFVTVRHGISGGDGLAVVDEHDIVYREDSGDAGASARPGEPAPDDAEWTETVAPDPTLLFRYSALTFNGHRIHYDRTYARDVEGYGGLVVHGPLLATYMCALAGNVWRDRPVSGFEFRGMRPVLDTEAFSVCGRADGDTAIDMWIANDDGHLAMQGRTTFE